MRLRGTGAALFPTFSKITAMYRQFIFLIVFVAFSASGLAQTGSEGNPFPISKARLLHNFKIEGRDTAYHITKCTVSIRSKKGEYFGPYVVKGNHLTENVLNIITRLDAGSKIYFESIECVYLGKLNLLNPMVYVLKW